MISKIREFNSKAAILMVTGDIYAEKRMIGFKDVPVYKKSYGVEKLKMRIDEVMRAGKH